MRKENKRSNIKFSRNYGKSINISFVITLIITILLYTAYSINREYKLYNSGLSSLNTKFYIIIIGLLILICIIWWIYLYFSYLRLNFYLTSVRNL